MENLVQLSKPKGKTEDKIGPTTCFIETFSGIFKHVILFECCMFKRWLSKMESLKMEVTIFKFISPKEGGIIEKLK